MFVYLQRRKIKGRHEKKYFKIISLNEAKGVLAYEFHLYATGTQLHQPNVKLRM